MVASSRSQSSTLLGMTVPVTAAPAATVAAVGVGVLLLSILAYVYPITTIPGRERLIVAKQRGLPCDRGPSLASETDKNTTGIFNINTVVLSSDTIESVKERCNLMVENGTFLRAFLDSGTQRYPAKAVHCAQDTVCIHPFLFGPGMYRVSVSSFSSAMHRKHLQQCSFEVDLQPQQAHSTDSKNDFYIQHGLGYFEQKEHLTFLPAAFILQEQLQQKDALQFWIDKKRQMVQEIIATPKSAINNITFIGDSFMRTNYQALVNILESNTFPFKSLNDFWCESIIHQTIECMETQSKGQFSVFGEGCYSGGAMYERDSLSYRYLAILNSGDGERDIGTLHDISGTHAIVMNFGMHDVSMFSLREYEDNIRSIMENLVTTYPQIQHKILLGSWAQNIDRKPEEWGLTSYNQKLIAMNDIVRTVAEEYSAVSLDTFWMSSAMLENNFDGVHYDLDVTESIAYWLLYTFHTLF